MSKSAFDTNLNEAKLWEFIDNNHPRDKDEKGKVIGPLSLCETFGYMPRSELIVTKLDKYLGKTVSVYFKILKIFIFLMIVMSIFCIPFYVIYSAGEVSTAPTSILSRLSMGNLGQDIYACA